MTAEAMRAELRELLAGRRGRKRQLARLDARIAELEMQLLSGPSANALPL